MQFPRTGPAVRCVALAALLAGAAGCRSSSDPSPDDGGTPDAAPMTKEHAEAAGQAAAHRAPPDGNVLAWVNGEAVNRRDVMLRVGPQLATVGSEDERRAETDRAVLEILRERIVDRAARDAGVEVTRDEIDRERARRIREIEKNRGTLDAFLRERGMSAREFDDEIAREVRMSRFIRAKVGISADASVPVRPVTDTFVTPREIRAFYDRNPDRFREPETGRVRVLRIPADLSSGNREQAVAAARAKAERAKARLLAGEDFVPVFRETNAANPTPDPADGLVEITKKGELDPWIEEVAFTRPRGTVDMREAGIVFYVVRAEGASPARVVPFEEAHERIERLLGELKRGIASYEVELDLLEKAAIAPRDRYDALREFLAGTRRRLITEAGI